MFEENIRHSSLDSVLQKPKERKKSAAAARPADIPAMPRQTGPVPESAAAYRPRGEKNYPKYSAPSRARKSFLRTKKFWFGLFSLAVLLGVAWLGMRFVDLGQKIWDGKSPLSFLSGFGQLLTSSDRPLVGEDTGRVNILLLGIGGEGHDGALLTDTMLVASIKPPKDNEPAELALLSIPRDMYVKLPAGLDWRKINSAYAYGELKEKGLGFTWARSAVEEVTGQTIPYHMLIDFAGFKKAIDDVGGIDVNVENAFTDSAYPDYKHGYLPTLKFETGMQHMDGERALQFARSRHGTNGEGTDFARSRRQEKIISALKDKVQNLRLKADVGTINRLLGDFADHFRTNMQVWELKRLNDLMSGIKKDNILSLSLDPSTYLVCGSIAQDTGAYIIDYCPGKTKTDVYRFVEDEFNIGRLIKEAARIQFQNSTKVVSLAVRAEAMLKIYDFETSTLNFPGKDIYPKTIIYDLAKNAKPQTLSYLKDKLQAETAVDYPYLDKLAEPKPDFVVVLGSDAPVKIQKMEAEAAKLRKSIIEPADSDIILK